MSVDRQLSGDPLPSLTRLKWLAIIAPVAFLAIVGYMLHGPFHEAFHEFPVFLYVMAFLTVAVSAFSFLVFAIVGKLEQRILNQNRELAALLAVGRAVTSPLSYADQFAQALDAVLSVSSAEAVELWLVDEDGDLTLEQHRGVTEATRRGAKLRRGEGLPGLALQRDEMVHATALASESRLLRSVLVDLGFTTFAALPLRYGTTTVGVMAVGSRDDDALSTIAEQRLLEGIGRELAVAIENAHLHGRVLDRAVLEERERLARELHDSLAQLLGYVNTQTMAIKKLLASGQDEEARLQVAEMEANAKRVYREVREAILGLRSARPGLVSSLQSYLAGLALISGAAPALEVSEEAAAFRLPDAVEIQLTRIIQEALTNVRKHAKARSASVTLGVQEDRLLVRIEDDGCGFDPARPVRTGWPHFGLQTMKERAHAVGGTFAVESVPGVGTRVLVQVPGNSTAGGVHADSDR